MKTIHQSISILNRIMNKILGGISRPPNMASLWHYSLIIDLFCRRSFSVSRDLHFEEIRLVEALVDVSEFSEELNRLVPNILVLLVHEKQLGLKSGTVPYWQDNEFYKWVFFFTHLMTDSSWTWWWWWSVNKTLSASTSLASRYSKVYWRRKTKLKRRCERVYLDVFSPCYENQDEAGGEEDEEECSNNFQAAQLVTTYLLYGSITYITCMVVSHISHIYHIYHMYITCMGVTTCHISYIGVSFHSIWSKCPFFRISVKAREQKVLTERERLTGLRDWVLTPVMFVDTATPHMETNFHHSLFFNRVLTHKMGCSLAKS